MHVLIETLIASIKDVFVMHPKLFLIGKLKINWI